MLRGLYTATTAMIAQSRRLDVISNNLTNTLTYGYKADNLMTESFRDMMISAVDSRNGTAYQFVGPHNTGIHIDTINIAFEQGPLENTDVNTDIALEGEGFFAVRNASGEEVYTRAGNFLVDANGYLVTPTGEYLLDENGSEIYIRNIDFEVDSQGLITKDGAQIATLGIFTFPDPQLLNKQGNNLYANVDPANNQPTASDATVLQGFLEGSNVDVARETVDLMQTYRAYEINQKIAQMYDESLGKAVNDIGRVSG